MVMLSNGCICCQAGSDLALTVDALLAAERPADSGPLRRIILETSGLSKPGSDPAPARKPRGLPDADHGGRHLRCNARDRSLPRSRKRSRNGPRRTASSSPRRMPFRDEGLARAKAEVEALNPLAEIVATADRAEAVAAAFAPLARALPMPALPRVAAGAAHPRIAVRLARPAGVLELRRSRGVARQSRGRARRSPAAAEGPGARHAKRAADPCPKRRHGVLDPSPSGRTRIRPRRSSSSSSPAISRMPNSTRYSRRDSSRFLPGLNLRTCLVQARFNRPWWSGFEA